MMWQLCDDCGGRGGKNAWDNVGYRNVFIACGTCKGLGEVYRDRLWSFLVTILPSLGMWIVLGLAARGAWDLLHWVGGR